MHVSLAAIVFICLFLGAAAVYARHRLGKTLANLQANCLQARSDLDCIANGMSSGMMIVDRHGLIQKINPAALRILAIRDPIPAGRAINDVLSAGHYEFTRCIAHVLSGGEAIHRREIELHLQGDRAPVGVSVNNLGEDNENLGAVALFQDLSEVKRMREQIREADRLAAIGELSASIAHEIRNPLCSIRGSAEILASDLKLDDNEAKLMQLILKESRRVNTIITNFLAFARQPLMNPSLIDVPAFMQELALQIRFNDAGTANSLHIAVDVFPEDMLLYADEEQLRQVILNLARNAIEATGDGAEILLQAELDVPGKQAILRVRDNGPGVPAEERERIFEPFHTGRSVGTGLGLPIVKRIVVAHGGRVHVADGQDGGAVFEVHLPLSRSPIQELVEI